MGARLYLKRGRPLWSQVDSADKNVSKIQAAPTFHSFPDSPRAISGRQEKGTALSVRSMIRVASLCLFGYWLVLFTATHLPSHSMPKVAFSDKIQHAIAYAGLGFLLAWAIPKQATWQRHLTLTFCVGVIYAALDEITQKFIPGRHCDWWDFVADAVGVCLGLSAYLALRAILMQLSWGRKLIFKLSR